MAIPMFFVERWLNILYEKTYWLNLNWKLDIIRGMIQVTTIIPERSNRQQFVVFLNEQRDAVKFFIRSDDQQQREIVISAKEYPITYLRAKELLDCAASLNRSNDKFLIDFDRVITQPLK